MHSYTRHLGDYIKDTRHLTLLEHGAYNVLMDWCYSSERALPPDEAMLFRICAAFTKPEQLAVVSVIEQFFQKTPDGWLQKRIEEELMKAHEKRGKAKDAALQRWNADAMRTHSESDADAMQTHSEGNADAMPRVRALRNPVSLSLSNPPNPRQRGKSGKLTVPLFPEDLPDGYAQPLTLWFGYKQERREGYTQSGWSVLLAQQLRFPASIVAASVEASMASNWAGLFTDKLVESTSHSPGMGWQKKEGAAVFVEAPAVQGTDAPEGWEEAMDEVWGEGWREIYACWRLVPHLDQAKVRAVLAKKEGGAK